jgi:hypothetical protein
LEAGRVLVMGEVEARRDYDAAVFAVTPKSQERIARAAQALAGRRRRDAPIRLDIVVVGAGLCPRHERAAWFDESRRRALIFASLSVPKRYSGRLRQCVSFCSP